MHQEKNIKFPVAVFLYNRLQHSKNLIESLKRNYVATETKLFIFSDGPKTSNEESAVNEVRKYIETIDGFNSIEIIKSNKNRGLASSIIKGTSQVLKSHNAIIVLEDDLIVSKYFLDYMNHGLNTYQSNSKILSISGFTFPSEFTESIENNLYFHPRPMSWGWATWQDRWECVDWDMKKYPDFIKSMRMINKFNEGGTDLTNMLMNQSKGIINSWYIRWTFHSFLHNKVSLYPGVSYVNNNGFDGTGVHCGNKPNTIHGHRELAVNPIELNDATPEHSASFIKNFNKAFNKKRRSHLKFKFKLLTKLDSRLR